MVLETQRQPKSSMQGAVGREEGSQGRARRTGCDTHVTLAVTGAPEGRGRAGGGEDPIAATQVCTWFSEGCMYRMTLRTFLKTEWLGLGTKTSTVQAKGGRGSQPGASQTAQEPGMAAGREGAGSAADGSSR